MATCGVNIIISNYTTKNTIMADDHHTISPADASGSNVDDFTGASPDECIEKASNCLSKLGYSPVTKSRLDGQKLFKTIGSKLNQE